MGLTRGDGPRDDDWVVFDPPRYIGDGGRVAGRSGFTTKPCDVYCFVKPQWAADHSLVITPSPYHFSIVQWRTIKHRFTRHPMNCGSQRSPLDPPDPPAKAMGSVGESNPLRPSYYLLPGGIEVKDVTGHLSHFKGSAVDYVLRAGNKPGNDEIHDLGKAIEFLQFEVKRLEMIRKFADRSDEIHAGQC